MPKGVTYRPPKRVRFNLKDQVGLNKFHQEVRRRQEECDDYAEWTRPLTEEELRGIEEHTVQVKITQISYFSTKLAATIFGTGGPSTTDRRGRIRFPPESWGGKLIRRLAWIRRAFHHFQKIETGNLPSGQGLAFLRSFAQSPDSPDELRLEGFTPRAGSWEAWKEKARKHRHTLSGLLRKEVKSSRQLKEKAFKEYVQAETCKNSKKFRRMAYNREQRRTALRRSLKGQPYEPTRKKSRRPIDLTQRGFITTPSPSPLPSHGWTCPFGRSIEQPLPTSPREPDLY
jgi:hypothetical protein